MDRILKVKEKLDRKEDIARGGRVEGGEGSWAGGWGILWFSCSLGALCGLRGREKVRGDQVHRSKDLRLVP